MEREESDTTASSVSTNPSPRSTRCDYLNSKIRKLNIYCNNVERVIDNNWTSDGPFIPSGVITGKQLVLNGLTDELKKIRPERSWFLCDDVEEDALLEIYTEELRNINLQFETLSRELEEERKHIKRLEYQLVTLKSLELSDIYEEERNTTSAQFNAAKIKFKRYRTIMDKLLEEIFPDSVEDVRDILADVSRAFFEGESRYVDLINENHNFNAISSLVVAKLLIQNPYERDLYRLDID